MYTLIYAHANGPTVLSYNVVENKNGGHTKSTLHHSWVFTHEGEGGDWRGIEPHTRGTDAEPF